MIAEFNHANSLVGPSLEVSDFTNDIFRKPEGY